jgi:hypothetical protein
MRSSARSPSQFADRAGRDHGGHQRHIAADREAKKAERHELGDVGDADEGPKVATWP